MVFPDDGRASATPGPRIARRVAATFAVQLALLAVALGMTVHTFRSLSAAEAEVLALDSAKHAGHNVAGLVREQYIHQAHTIIAGNRSHVDHYRTAAQDAGDATRRLLSLPLTADERARASQIAGLVRQIDGEFSSQILPAVDAGNRRLVEELHERAESEVSRVTSLSESLNRTLEARAMRANEREQMLSRYAAVLVIGCFILAIVVAATTWLVIGRSVLSRLGELRRGALILAQGNLESRVPVRGSDEVSILAATLNDMAGSLQNHQQRLIQSQRLAVVGQVAAGVAHEINNPLGVILGYVRLLERGEPLLPGLRIIEDEARHCQRIVEGLLGLTRPIPSRRTTVDLVELARDAVERFAEAPGVDARRLRAPTGDARVLTSGDPSALRQVLSNLLQNALEATTESGTVVVSVRGHAGFAEVEVSDDGEGMSEETRAKAFDPFFTTKSKGTGLGLAISQAIVVAHDGSIELTSTPGAGTRAMVRLPLAREPERLETH
jgi:two-component system, NtrC family, sensor kinase